MHIIPQRSARRWRLHDAGMPDETILEGLRQVVETGMSPLQVADLVFDAIRDGRLYVLTHPEMSKQAVRMRMEGILQKRNPESS